MHSTRNTLLPICAASLAFIIAGVAPSFADVTVNSAPLGVMSAPLPRGESPMAVPLIGEDAFVGTALSNSGNSVTFDPAMGSPADVLETGGRYYVEIVTGALEGERFDIDLDASSAALPGEIVLDLAATSFSTLGSIPDGALADARCMVRPHLTLDRLRTMFSPDLQGHRSATRADAVKLLGDRGMEVFHLGDDGESWFAANGAGHGSFAWRFMAWLDRVQNRGGGGGDRTDYRHLVVPPDVSFVVDLARTGKRLTQRGLVRTSAFRKNLVTGRQSFATGFPAALAPAEVGARVDPSTSAANRWTGSNLFLFADQFEIATQNDFGLYYLRADGHTWRELLGNPQVNHENLRILGATDFIVVRRLKPDPEFVIPSPFQP